ncbi:hypothetical protein V8E55_002142 [Tylopilus felleus]
MAKSLRSKSKRSFRAKKRESGKYAAAEAARLNRLNAKLAAVKDMDRPAPDDEEEMEAESEPQGAVANVVEDGQGMAVDGSDQSDKKPGSVSTHGPRGSRREEWRKSRGLVPIPKRQGMNRQGGLAARRKGGRPSRRR